MVLGERSGTAHAQGVRAAAVEIVQRFLPVGGVRQCTVPVSRAIGGNVDHTELLTVASPAWVVPPAEHDRGIPSELSSVPSRARELEELGYRRLLDRRDGTHPFFPLLLAAEHTTRLQLGTSIAVAFAPQPMVVAISAGTSTPTRRAGSSSALGTQVQAHIESVRHAVEPPARRMREFVAALQSDLDHLERGHPADFDGEFYTHRLMTPKFNPRTAAVRGAEDLHRRGRRPDDRTTGEVARSLSHNAFNHPPLSGRGDRPRAAGRARCRRRARRGLRTVLPVVRGDQGETEEQFAAARCRTPQTAGVLTDPPGLYRRVLLELHGWGDLHNRAAPAVAAGRVGHHGEAVRRRDAGHLRGGRPSYPMPRSTGATVCRSIDRVLPGFPAGDVRGGDRRCVG